jgi:hypothetical protein
VRRPFGVMPLLACVDAPFHIAAIELVGDARTDVDARLAEGADDFMVDVKRRPTGCGSGLVLITGHHGRNVKTRRVGGTT